MILQRRASAAGLDGYKADIEYNRKFGGAVKTIINEKYEVIRYDATSSCTAGGRSPGRTNL